MVALLDVYGIATDNNVVADCFEMVQIQSVSCQTSAGECYIGIDPMQLQSADEEKVVLAHELGHCLTGSFYNKDNILDVRGRHEYRANRWAVECLVPWPELQCALDQGIVERWELAERFEVTEDFIDTTIQMYRRQGKLT